MADLSGLVVGDVELASLFDSCVDSFKYLRIGRASTGQFSASYLSICLLQLRLTRWGEATRLNRPSPLRQANDHRFFLLREALTSLEGVFEEEKRQSMLMLKAARNMGSGIEAYSLSSDMSPRDQAVVGSLKHIVDRRSPRGRVRPLEASKWTVCKKEQLRALVDSVHKYLAEIENLFPPRPEAVNKLCKAELAEIEEFQGSIELLCNSTQMSRFDPALNTVAQFQIFAIDNNIAEGGASGSGGGGTRYQANLRTGGRPMDVAEHDRYASRGLDYLRAPAGRSANGQELVLSHNGVPARIHAVEDTIYDRAIVHGDVHKRRGHTGSDYDNSNHHNGLRSSSSASASASASSSSDHGSRSGTAGTAQSSVYAVDNVYEGNRVLDNGRMRNGPYATSAGVAISSRNNRYLSNVASDTGRLQNGPSFGLDNFWD